MFKTTNKKIAVTPPVSKSVKIQVQGGLARVEQHVKLTPYQVLYPNCSGYPVGTTLYLSGDSIKWNLPVHQAEDGTSFVLVEESQVVGYEDDSP